MIVKIPVRPHIKKFLESRLTSSYRLSERDHFGRFLLSLLRKPRKDKRFDLYSHRYSSYFEIDISSFQVFHLMARNISSKNVSDFNEFVDGIFKETIFNEIDIITEHEIMPIRTAIYRIMRKYNIEIDVDYSYFGLRKAYYRYAKKKSSRLSA